MRLYWLWEIQREAGDDYHESDGDYFFHCGCWANSQRKKHEPIGKYTWERCALHGGPAERKPIMQIISEMRPPVKKKEKKKSAP